MLPPQTMPPSRRPAGFTLTEILAVVAVIGLLMGIAANTIVGVARRSVAERARSQLIAIGEALAQYKQQYGDYPHTEKPEDLYDSLTGLLGPKDHVTLSPKGKVFLSNLSRFTLSAPDKIGASGAGTNTLLDPWEKPFIYVYKSPEGPSWKNPGYVLFSDGPDGKHTTIRDERGFPPRNPTGSDADNIYEPQTR